MQPTLLSSPLQGFTDFRFRNAFHAHFGGIDTFYSPYIRLNGKLNIRGAYERDILLENNNTLTVIPQVMTILVHFNVYTECTYQFIRLL